MMKAMPQLLQQHPELLYCIVGDGDERSSLTELVHQLGLTSHVQFRHECSDEELVQCYQQCDLFVLPNREINGDIEGFGMVLLEAQACGKPVIAGNSGGTAETMIPGSTGHLVDCQTEDELIQIISHMLDDPSRREVMGAEAQKWVSGKFDWLPLSEAAEEFFLQLSPSDRRTALSTVHT
jgi:phosphatidylinositol alpha-1,6-mannosyltransferase